LLSRRGGVIHTRGVSIDQTPWASRHAERQLQEGGRFGAVQMAPKVSETGGDAFLEVVLDRKNG